MFPRVTFNKRSLSGSHSSHSNLSQTSVTSDVISPDDVDSPASALHPRISERRSNSSTDIQGTQVYTNNHTLILKGTGHFHIY